MCKPFARCADAVASERGRALLDNLRKYFEISVINKLCSYDARPTLDPDSTRYLLYFIVMRFILT